MNKILTILVASLLSISLFAPQVYAAEDRTSDTWLQAQLVTLYTVNRHLSVFDIDSNVSKGVVSLQGTVDSAVEKDLAEEIAKSIEGVKSVNNNLEVDSEAAAKRKAKRGDNKGLSFAQQFEDMTTTAAIKSKLLSNTNVHGMKVDVDTTAGAVILRGTVSTDEERSLVEKIADNTSGVKSVDNKITLDKGNS
jgi:osmotically-inducible protein OsmY